MASTPVEVKKAAPTLAPVEVDPDRETAGAAS